MELLVDLNIVEAVEIWIMYGIDPGSCARLMLEGNYKKAYKNAHVLIKPHWSDHVTYIETLPDECRGKNMKTWEGTKKNLF